jgi:hypothetical protein
MPDKRSGLIDEGIIQIVKKNDWLKAHKFVFLALIILVDDLIELPTTLTRIERLYL